MNREINQSGIVGAGTCLKAAFHQRCRSGNSRCALPFDLDLYRYIIITDQPIVASYTNFKNVPTSQH